MIGAEAGMKQKAWGARGLDLGRCLEEAWEVYKKNVLTLIVAAALWQVVSGLSLMVLAGPMTGGAAVLSLRAMRRGDRKVVLRDLFAGFGRFWPLLGLFVLSGVAIFCAFGMFLVPGLVLMTLWMYPVLFMVDRDLGVIDSLRASQRAVMERGFWAHAAMMGLGVGMVLLPDLLPGLGLLASWLLTPMAWLMVAAAYRQNDVAKPSPIEDWDGF
jgi:hypothetical protein